MCFLGGGDVNGVKTMKDNNQIFIIVFFINSLFFLELNVLQFSSEFPFVNFMFVAEIFSFSLIVCLYTKAKKRQIC